MVPAKPKAGRSRLINKVRTRGRRLLHYLRLPLVRRALLLAAVLALLFLWATNLTGFASHAWGLLYRTFGLGAVLFIPLALALAWLLWQQRLLSAFKRLGHRFRRWNLWLGGMAFALALWGIWGFFYAPGGTLGDVSLGGRLGQWIAGDSLPQGIVTVLALTLLGFLFIAPRGTVTVFHALFLALGKALRAGGRGLLMMLRGIYMGAVLSIRGLAGAYGRYPVHRGIIGLARLVRRRRPVAPMPPPPRPAAEVTPQPPKPVPAPAPAPRPELEEAAQRLGQRYVASAPAAEAGWQLPPLDLLDRAGDVEWGQMDDEHRARHIEEALASYGVEAKVVQINRGPTVTQFGVEPGWDRKFKEVKERDEAGAIKVRRQEVSKTRVKVDRIAALASDLAMTLAVPSIRIEAPVPGKPMVGIEVPNTSTGLVSLRGVIESAPFQKAVAKSRLTLALGRGAGGEAVVTDLARMPHLLIAGATGSGKTVCLNAIICCLLLHNTPDEVKFIIVDPKRVEMVIYNSIPHLASPVVVDSQKAINTLRWLNQEMDRRYERMAAAGARNIEAYNNGRPPAQGMPYLILIIDELADLMMTAFDEVERSLCRLAQLARATGIHLVVATQRPSVDVVTGLIKANFPTRISFALISQVDSRTILDRGGAEHLLGRGDMLYLPTDAAKPKRLQGCFVSEAEIERLVYFWNSQSQERPVPSLVEEVTPAPPSKPERPADPFLEAARRLAQEHKRISTSFLQRRLNIGYPRAARLMDTLIEEGVVPGESGKAKEGTQ